MSNTTNVGNFSVQSFNSIEPVPEGNPISDYLINYLTLVPDAGFEINASDFSATTPLPTYVSSVVFFQSTQDSKNVICQVQLIPGTVMPSGGIDIGLCISGFSNTANYSISGSFDYIRSINVVPATLGTAYNLSGHFETNENVFTQSVAAAPGYYFPQQPTISLSVGNVNNYNSSFSNVLDISGNIINTVFTVDYTFPALNITGDAWEIDASAELIYIPVIEINSYNVSTSAFAKEGGFRYYTIYGSEGANWSLTAVGTNGINDILSLSSDPFTNVLTGVLDSSGLQEIAINIPASTTGPQSFDLTIAGDLQSPFAQNTTTTLKQLSDVTITYSAVTSLGYLITPGNYTQTGFSYAAYVEPNLPTIAANWTIESNDPATVLIPRESDSAVVGNDFVDIEFLISGTNFIHSITPVDPATPPSNLPDVIGWNFVGDTSYGNYIEVQSVDFYAGEITFNTSISVLTGQIETISENKGNSVTLNIGASNSSTGVILAGPLSVNNFGFADTTFTFLVDELVTEVSLPSVVTTAISNESGTTADSGGETITDGNGSISSKGVQWSSLADFSVIDGTTEDGTGTADYVSNITGLTAGNTYYVRAYVVNEAGTAFGQVIQFVSSVSFPCGATIPSGGVGITDINVNLDSGGGLLAFALNAQGVPDKMEIIHGTPAAGTKVATTSLSANGNSGPFDNTYGTEPNNTIPTQPQAVANAQFIGTDIQNPWTVTKQGEFQVATGFSVPNMVMGGITYQQIVWWQYTTADYQTNPIATVRITGTSGTGWDAIRLCCPDGNCII